MTYTDFVARLAVLMEVYTATDLNWPTFLPAAFEVAAQRCYRKPDPLAVCKPGTLTTSTATIALRKDPLRP